MGEVQIHKAEQLLEKDNWGSQKLWGELWEAEDSNTVNDGMNGPWEIIPSVSQHFQFSLIVWYLAWLTIPSASEIANCRYEQGLTEIHCQKSNTLQAVLSNGNLKLLLCAQSKQDWGSILRAEGKRKKVVSKEKAGSNATALEQKCLAALLLTGLHHGLHGQLLVSILPVISQVGSEKEKDVISGEIPEQQSLLFLSYKQGLQVEVPSAGNAKRWLSF